MADFQTLGGTRRQPPTAPLTPAQQEELRRKTRRAEDITTARRQGHSDADIAAAIGAKSPEVKAALDRGYPASEVLGASVAVHSLGSQDLNLRYTNKNTQLIGTAARGRDYRANEAANPVGFVPQRAADYKAGGGLRDAITVKTGNPIANTILNYMNPLTPVAGALDAVGGVINMANAPLVREYRRGGGTESGAADLNSALNLFESFIPVEGAAAGASAAARGAQNVGSRVVGAVANRGTARAASLVSKSLGPDLERAVAALQAAPEGITARQALQEAGIDADTFMALGESVEKSAGGPVFRRLAEGQAADRASTMSKVAGGDTTTNAMLSADAAQRDLNAMSGPMREAAIARANLGRQIPPLEAKATRQRRSQARNEDITAIAEPLAARTAIDRGVAGRVSDQYSDEALYGSLNPLERPEVPLEVLNQLGAKAGLAQQGLDRATAAGVAAGNAARRTESKIAELRAAGIEPLDISVAKQKMREMADAPGTSTVEKRALRDAARELNRRAAASGGVIDARDIDEVRKNSLNDAIRKRLDKTDPTTLDRRVSVALARVRPLLDDALKAAGGDGWADYLATHASGMREIERQQLGAVAAALLRDSPKKFGRLVRGDAPEVVRETVGGGTYDIREALAPDNLPSRLPAMQEVNRQLKRDKRVADLAKSGKSAAEELLRKEGTITEKVLRRLVVHGNPKLAAADALASMLIDMRVAPQVQAALVEGFRSGKSAAELLVGVPAGDRSRLASALADPKFWTPVLRTGVVGGAVSNTMAPDNRNAMAR